MKEKGREAKRERGRCGREVRRKGQWQAGWGRGEMGVGPIPFGSTFKSNGFINRPIGFRIRVYDDDVVCTIIKEYRTNPIADLTLTEHIEPKMDRWASDLWTQQLGKRKSLSVDLFFL